MAAVAAAPMCRGVGWSGSPTLKSSTASPLALSAAARWATATVGDTSSDSARRERSVADPFSLMLGVRELGSEFLARSLRWGALRAPQTPRPGHAAVPEPEPGQA